MSLTLILQVLNAAVAVAQEGTQVYTLLSGVVQRLTAAQAAGTDPSAADWAYLDQLAAQSLVQLKGYTSMTEALLASTPAPASAGTGTGS